MKVNWGPLGETVFNRTYSRPKGDRFETWTEMVNRVVEGNLSLVDPKFIEPLEASRLAALIHSMKVMPGGRHLWVSGVLPYTLIEMSFPTRWSPLRHLVRFIYAPIREKVGSNVYVRLWI